MIDRNVRIMIYVRIASVEHGRYILIVASLLMILLSMSVWNVTRGSWERGDGTDKGGE